MSTIAEKVRLSKYDGGPRAPSLMDLSEEELKEGDRFYMHNTPSYDEIWKWFIPVVVSSVKRGYNSKGDRPLIIVMAWEFPYAVKEHMRYLDAAEFLNYNCLRVPSEPFMVLHCLKLMPELHYEILEYIGVDFALIQKHQYGWA